MFSFHTLLSFCVAFEEEEKRKSERKSLTHKVFLGFVYLSAFVAILRLNGENTIIQCKEWERREKKSKCTEYFFCTLRIYNNFWRHILMSLLLLFAFFVIVFSWVITSFCVCCFFLFIMFFFSFRLFVCFTFH